jgi:hypothetical protein
MAQEKLFNWVNFIRDVYSQGVASGSTKNSPVFHPPASRQDIDVCQRNLGAIFPGELKQLLLQTNGVSEQLTTQEGEINSGFFLFSAKHILETNIFQRTHTGDYTMPLDCILFFAEDGIGDYFGFAVIKGKVPHSRIYFWDHEDDSRRSIAPSLHYFIENWKLGKIKV